MSDDDLRRLLDFPDTQLHLPSLSSITARATRRHNQRLLTVAASVLALVAVLTLLRTTGLDLAFGPIPATAPTSKAAHITGPLDMGQTYEIGHGLTVRWTTDNKFCWSGDSSTHRTTRSVLDPPHQFCRDLRRVSGQRIQVLLFKTRGGGALYTGLVAWPSTRVSLRVHGIPHPADVSHLTAAGSWVMYTRWLNSRDSGAVAVAWDVCNQRHTHDPKGFRSCSFAVDP